MEKIGQDEMIAGLAAHSATPYRRSTLEEMSAEGLASVANSAGLDLEEIRAAAEAGDFETDPVLAASEREGSDRGEVAVNGVLADAPEGGGEPEDPPTVQEMVTLEEPEGDELEGVEIRNHLGPGESALEGDGPVGAEESDAEEELGFEVGGLLD